MRASEPALEVRAVGKRYGATVALEDVSFTLRAGEVCGLLGENGAGKSTLVKVLSGVVVPDSGEMWIGGTAYRPRNITDARTHGVATAFQELSLVPTLSVAVNLSLPHPAGSRFGLVRLRRLEEEAARILHTYGVADVHPGALVGELSLGVRQRIEIVRAMMRAPRVLLLDEPTSALSDREWLFALISRALDGGTSVLYISHKLDEIRRICHRCVVLRNGRKVLDSAVAVLSDAEIFSSMAGRSLVEAFPVASSTVQPGPPALSVKNLSAEGIADVDFTLARGEILGVAGLEGQGQSSLFRALAGLLPLRDGSIEVAGRRQIFRSPRAARRAGVVLVPEDRKEEGIFKDLTALANISLPIIGECHRLRFINRRAERARVEEVIPIVELAERYLPQNIEALSGGNQQKAVLARALIAGARCLLLFDPTRGVDVGAKQSIYRLIRRFAEEGGAVLFYSTELDELVHLCDRCLVIYRNRIAGELSRAALSQERILAIASGHSLPQSAQPEPFAENSVIAR
ncbi:MAG: sugar ABC transporter ATP-binding protein [Acetobacteraceae bacterium]|nr:sugar ABC transporter ATP-binding protein [Acetobacteraceae bacterium]